MDWLWSLCHARNHGAAEFVHSSESFGQTHLLLPARKHASRRQDGEFSVLERSTLDLSLRSPSSKTESWSLPMLSCVLMGFVLGRDAAGAKVTQAGCWQGWILCARNGMAGQDPWEAVTGVSNYVFWNICTFFSALWFRYWRQSFHLQNIIAGTIMK